MLLKAFCRSYQDHLSGLDKAYQDHLVLRPGEDVWLANFYRAWTIATTNGFDSLRRLS